MSGRRVRTLKRSFVDWITSHTRYSENHALEIWKKHKRLEKRIYTRDRQQSKQYENRYWVLGS